MKLNFKTVLLALGAVVLFIGLVAGIAWVSGPGVDDWRRSQEKANQRHEIEMRQECEAANGTYTLRKKEGHYVETYQCEWKDQ